MNIICDRKKLAAAYKAVAAHAPKKRESRHKPILRSVKLTADESVGVSLMSTDLEHSLSVNVPGVEIVEGGSTLLPVEFGKILTGSKDRTIALADGDGVVRVLTEHGETKLPIDDVNEFPVFCDWPEDSSHCYRMAGSLLKRAANRTVFAVGNDKSHRWSLAGVLFELSADKLTAVGTDGRRMAVVEVPATGEVEVNGIIASKVLKAIGSVDDHPGNEVQIVMREKEFFLRSTCGVRINSQLIEGTFPKWRGALPASDGSGIRLEVKPLMEALRHLSRDVSGDHPGVEFTFNVKLKLASHASNYELPLGLDIDTQTRMALFGEGVRKVRLDPKYILEFLKTLDKDEEVLVEVQPNKPVLFTAGDTRYVVMPIVDAT